MLSEEHDRFDYKSGEDPDNVPMKIQSCYVGAEQLLRRTTLWYDVGLPRVPP